MVILMTLDWGKLHVGKITQAEILRYCVNEEGSDWQKLRASLKGKSLEEKYVQLAKWLRAHKNSRAAQVQVTNYINALKRGGLIP